MVNFHAETRIDKRQESSASLLAYLDYAMFFCLFLYCNAIWLWPTDAQLGGFEKPFGNLHNYISMLGVVWPFLRARDRTWPFNATNVVLFLFLVLIFVSGFWSEDTAATTRDALVFLSFVQFSRFYVARYGGVFVLNQLLLLSTLVVAVSLLFAFLGFDFALMRGIHEGLWRGLFGHKNPFGTFAAFYLVLLLLAGRQLGYRTSVLLILSGLPLIALIKAGSSTAIVGVLFALFLVALVCMIKSFARSVALTWACLLLISAVGFVVVSSNYTEILSLFGRDSSFSGRDMVWLFFSRIVESNSSFGTGYGTSYLPDGYLWGAQEQLFSAVRSPHNAYLALALNLGWVGSALYALWLAANFVAAVGSVQRKGVGMLYLAYCGMAGLLGLVETTGFADITRGDFFFLYIASLMATRVERRGDQHPMEEGRR